MAKEIPLSFGDFVDAMNRDASFAALRQSLGAASGPVIDYSAIAQASVEKVLMRSRLDSEQFEPIRDAVVAGIAGCLKPPEGQRVTSMLDITTLGLTDDQQIRQFLFSHGIDLNSEKDRRYASEVFQEAIRFFNEYIGAKKNYKVHPSLQRTRSIGGIMNIFKIAAGQTSKRVIIPQACALLRIAYAIYYLDHDPVLNLLPQSEAAIGETLEKYIRRSPGSREPMLQTGGNATVVPLIRFERRRKLRDRMIMKLLHKPDNLAAEVLDGIGARIRTHRPINTIRVLYYLFFNPDGPILPAMNIRIRHTKDLLLNAATLADVLGDEEKARALVRGASMPVFDLEDLTLARAIGRENDNPCSAGAYQAIHIVFDVLVDIGDGTRRLVPGEIQILDEETNKRNEEHAAHCEYVERQEEEVQDRLMRRNLVTAYEATGRDRERRGFTGAAVRK